MGTNYYAHVDPCEHCGRAAQVIHLGKSSMGWKFHHRAYREIDWDGPGERWESHAGMMAWLRERAVRIEDEHGRDISVSHFEALIESKQSEKHAASEDHPPPDPRSSYREWVDDQGYEMSTGEFS